MQRFLKENYFNNRHLTIRKVKVASILVLLRNFEKQETITSQSFKETTHDQRNFKTDYKLSERDGEYLGHAASHSDGLLLTPRK